MNINEPDGSGSQQSIADQNVERLLRTAYDPEVPEAEFVERVRARMRLAGRERRKRRRTRHPAVVVVSLPKTLAWAAAAAVVLVGLGGLISHAVRQAPSERRCRSSVARSRGLRRATPIATS